MSQSKARQVREERLAEEREIKILNRTEKLVMVAAMLGIQRTGSGRDLVADAEALLDAAEQSATRFVDAGLSEDPFNAE